MTGELDSFVEFAAPGMAVAPTDNLGSAKMSRCGSGSSWISLPPKLSDSRASFDTATVTALALTDTVSSRPPTGS